MSAATLPAYHFIEQLKACPDVATIILFGSRARGDARPHSDIDLAIELNPKRPSALAWQAVQAIIDQADTLLPIDCVNLNSHTSAALRANIERDGVILYKSRNL